MLGGSLGGHFGAAGEPKPAVVDSVCALGRFRAQGVAFAGVHLAAVVVGKCRDWDAIGVHHTASKLRRHRYEAETGNPPDASDFEGFFDFCRLPAPAHPALSGARG